MSEGYSESAIKDIQLESFCLVKQDFHRHNRNCNWQKFYCNLPRTDKLSFRHITAEKNNASCQQKIIVSKLVECTEKYAGGHKKCSYTETIGLIN